MSARICLVSSSPVASNPRLVKEADALVESGYDVRVVATEWSADLAARNRDVLATARWRYSPVRRGSQLAHAWRVGLHRFGRIVVGARRSIGWRQAAWAQSWAWKLLLAEAEREPVDLLIGHNLPALPAVVLAAEKLGARASFDIEDDHANEFPCGVRSGTEHLVRNALMHQLLPRTALCTAASPGIAKAVAERYRVAPTVVLNVFPLAERASVPPPPRPVGEPLRLYWYSQTIGLDRGLTHLISALARSGVRTRLTLRGHASHEAELALRNNARDARVDLDFRPLAPPSRMTELAADHDVGVCVEEDDGGNRGIALANKLFTFLLAGLPMILSDTPAHRELASSIGACALVVDPRAPDAPERIGRWLRDPEALRARAADAWRLGSERYNWEIEKQKFLAVVQQALAR